MTMPIMKENEFSFIGKAITTVGVIVLVLMATFNAWPGEVTQPFAFGIAIVGFLLFFFAKLSVVARAQWIRFGSRRMSPGIAASYRCGYWLMVVGILATFL